MADFQTTITVAEANIPYMLEEKASVNADRAAQDPPLAELNNAEFAQFIMDNAVDYYVRKNRQASMDAVRIAWADASDAQRAAALTALGLS